MGKIDRRRQLHLYAYLFLALSFLVLVSTSQTLFHYFKCHEFSDPELLALNDGRQVWFLYKDYSINCDDERYYAYRWYAALMILVYPIGTPLVYLVMLLSKRRILRSSSLVAREHGFHCPNIGSILFLVQSYKAEFYWFEILETGRRLILASAIGVVSSDSAASPVLGILICYFFNYVFGELKPYTKSDDNQQAIVLSYSLSLLFLAALMIKVQVASDDSADQAAFGAALSFVLVIGPVGFIFMSWYAPLVRFLDRFTAWCLDEDFGNEKRDGDSTASLMCMKFCARWRDNLSRIAPLPPAAQPDEKLDPVGKEPAVLAVGTALASPKNDPGTYSSKPGRLPRVDRPAVKSALDFEIDNFDDDHYGPM